MISTNNDWKLVSGSKGYLIGTTIYGLHTLGIHGDGSNICVVGQNDYGQLGLGTTQPIYKFDCSTSAGIPIPIFDGYNEIKVYPNPAICILNISISDKEPINNQINVFDLNGKQVPFSNISLSNSAIQLDISSLPKGMYVLEIVLNDKALRTKVVKE